MTSPQMVPTIVAMPMAVSSYASLDLHVLCSSWLLHLLCNMSAAHIQATWLPHPSLGSPLGPPERP
jgi:hypothetical protein